MAIASEFFQRRLCNLYWRITSEICTKTAKNRHFKASETSLASELPRVTSDKKIKGVVYPLFLLIYRFWHFSSRLDCSGLSSGRFMKIENFEKFGHFFMCPESTQNGHFLPTQHPDLSSPDSYEAKNLYASFRQCI